MIWVNIVPHMSKGARYTMGVRIENKFIDLLELTYLAYFSKKENKIEKISECILALDTLKFIISTAWDAKFISHKHFEDIAPKLEEAGRMLGGWKNKQENIRTGELAKQEGAEKKNCTPN